MANVTALAAARHAVLARAGWDVEARGLAGAPALRVIASAESHATVFNALRLLGLGRDTAVRVRRRRAGPDATPPRSPRRSRRGDGPGDRLRAGGQREHRRVRPARARSSPPAARTARGATSTARSGCGPPPRPARAHLTAGVDGADSWARRRAQVAQRPLRLRARDRRRPGGAAPPRCAHRAVPHARRRARAQRRRLGARGVAPRARLPALRGAARARARRRRRARRALLRARRAGSPSGWPPSPA